ncbi:hypothetical protein ES703_79927 [subsurface metagenome]
MGNEKAKVGTSKCTTSRQLAVSLLTIILITPVPTLAAIVPISDIPMQTVQGYRTSPPYEWTYAFDIGFSDLQLDIEIGIGLTGDDPGSDLRLVWENGIEGMWGLQYDIIDDYFHYHVNFDVVFPIDPYVSVHHTVTVIDGQGSGDMLNWYTTSAWGEEYNGVYVAHEVGHMFSLYDEYTGGAQDPSNPIVDYSSIMGDLRGVTKERHYDPFLNWLQAMAPDHELTIGEYDPDWVIPEPATVLLLGLGSLALLRNRSRMRRFPMSF